MGKPDPRAEPDSIRAPAAGGQVDHSIDRVVSEITATPTAAEPASGVTAKETPSAPEVDDRKKKESGAKVTNADPRFAELEPLIETNDWKAVAAKLGPIEEAGKLPPNLGLIAAIAQHEALEDGGPDARALAIRCMAGLLGLPADNEVVRILSRRMLRKNVVKLRERQAPPARWSAFIVAVVLALGAGVGWFLSSSYGNRLAHTLHLR